MPVDSLQSIVGRLHSTAAFNWLSTSTHSYTHIQLQAHLSGHRVHLSIDWVIQALNIPHSCQIYFLHCIFEIAFYDKEVSFCLLQQFQWYLYIATLCDSIDDCAKLVAYIALSYNWIRSLRDLILQSGIKECLEKHIDTSNLNRMMSQKMICLHCHQHDK